MSRAQNRDGISPQLRRVQERARAHPEERFTSLAHHLSESALLEAYNGLKANAGVGIDRQSKADYGRHLSANIRDLHQRLKQGRYRASPVKRVWLDKPDGGQRPIGLPTVEDKIVQSAVGNVLNAIYECDFRGLSYGFRPERNQHQALQAAQTFLQKGQVNWVLDLDLKACFDTIEHEALMEAVQRRVTDRTILRLIRKWLTVGVVEANGQRERSRRGTPQGAVISPLLANIVLHYAMDEVVTQWRRTEAQGEVYCVRYADDAVLAFEHEADAHALKARLEASLADYGLALNQAKTRLIRFGRHWPDRGIKPETFDFLGFTHIVGTDRKGRYLVLRKTARKRFRRHLFKVTAWLRKHRHRPLDWQWRKLCKHLLGYYQYYGIRGNYRALARYRWRLWRLWYQSLSRRSQKSNGHRLTHLLTEVFPLPKARITHSEGWMNVTPGDLLGRAGCGNAARPVL